MYLFLVPIIFFILYVVFETVKQAIYFFPSTTCNYPNIYKNIFIEENNHNIHGWLYETEESPKIILYCHGNAGNIGNRLHIMKEWQDKGYSIFLFDYPGYGLSKGNPTEKSLYSSTEEALKYLLKFKSKKDIILYGESIGCSVATYVANKYNIETVILQSGFSSIKEVGKDYLPNYLHWILKLIKDFDTYKYLSQHNGRSLIMHSKDDEIIKYRHAEKLNDFSTEFYEIKGTHNNPIYNLDKVIEFIENSEKN